MILQKQQEMTCLRQELDRTITERDMLRDSASPGARLSCRSGGGGGSPGMHGRGRRDAGSDGNAWAGGGWPGVTATAAADGSQFDADVDDLAAQLAAELVGTQPTAGNAAPLQLPLAPHHPYPPRQLQRSGLGLQRSSRQLASNPPPPPPPPTRPPAGDGSASPPMVSAFANALPFSFD